MSDTVRIARARLFMVALPLREPFAISGGTMDVRRSLIVEIIDSDGNRGAGESAPFELPFYSSETIASASACLATIFLPAIVGKTFEGLAAMRDALDGMARGNRMARAGVETAWWDLNAARRQTSLVSLVSGRLAEMGVRKEWLARSGRIQCGVALGIPPAQDPGVLRGWVRDAIGTGYRRIKLKVRPGWDVEPVRTAQEEMKKAGQALPLWVDANGAYRLERDGAALRALDGLGLLFLEQPLPEDALWDSRELGRQIRTPVCLDESLTSDDVARQIIEMDGPRIWNIKIQRVGGLEEACRIYARAAGSDVRLWGGTMPETGLGAQAMLALGVHAGFVFPSDLEPSERWYDKGRDLVDLKMAPDGTMAVPEARPKIDVESRAELLGEFG